MLILLQKHYWNRVLSTLFSMQCISRQLSQWNPKPFYSRTVAQTQIEQSMLEIYIHFLVHRPQNFGKCSKMGELDHLKQTKLRLRESLENMHNGLVGITTLKALRQRKKRNTSLQHIAHWIIANSVELETSECEMQLELLAAITPRKSTSAWSQPCQEMYAKLTQQEDIPFRKLRHQKSSSAMQKRNFILSLDAPSFNAVRINKVEQTYSLKIKIKAEQNWLAGIGSVIQA